MRVWQALFRAVLPAELADIPYRSEFMNLAGIEHKYFATSLDGARRYAMLAEQAFGDGPFTIVATRIDRSLIADESRVLVDGAIATVTIPTDLLYALERPLVLEDE